MSEQVNEGRKTHEGNEGPEPRKQGRLEANFEFFQGLDPREYAGKWVCIINRQVMIADEDQRQVAKKAKELYQAGKGIPFIGQVVHTTV